MNTMGENNTTFSSSANLEDEEQWVWCPHDQLVWTRAKVLSVLSVAHEGDDENVDLTDESKIEYLLSFPDSPGMIKRLKADQVHRVDITHLQNLDNLCLLNDMHEAPLLDLLRRRFFDTKIYTFTGDVLISINPYELIDGLYTNPSQHLQKDSFGQATEDSNASGVDSVMNSITKNGESKTPHVYRIANKSLECLRQPSLVNQSPEGDAESNSAQFSNQSIVISGESGAGKTENSKHVLNFLIYANNYFSSQFKVDSQSSQGANFEEHLKAVLLNSSIVLEAFGNAKTVRNDNSSRFGKYIKLMYRPLAVDNSSQTFPHLVSATTETFLLEKSRLASVGKGERTYHIFYQLIAGLDLEHKVSLSLEEMNEGDFHLLSQGSCLSTRADYEEFHSTVQALSILQFTSGEVEQIYCLLACILHLGNIACESHDDSSVAVKINCSTASLEKLAEFLGVQAATLTIALTTQELTVAKRSSIKIKILSVGEVENNISALIKWLYSKLFDYIVRKINQCHQSISNYTSEQGSFIGILDIFGFEILNTNSFEQLCINFTNERLQQQFNEHVFISEQAMYASEGLEWSNITFKDNQSIIDVISSTKKPLGLLCILEEQGLLNRKPDDVALLCSFNQVQESNPANTVVNSTSNTTTSTKNVAVKGSAGLNPSALYSKSRFGNNSFVLKHFAGEVMYTIDGFLSKNNDSLQEDLMKLLSSTTNNFIITVGQIVPRQRKSIIGSIAGILGGSSNSTNNAVPGNTSAAGGKKMAASASISNQFRLQLDNLMATLRSTTPHYIKCIKPNSLKQAGNIDSTLVLQQLRYSGVLEVVRIRREGFPLRMSFHEFVINYYVLLPKYLYKQLMKPYLDSPSSNSAIDENNAFKLAVEKVSVEDCKEYTHNILRFALENSQYQIGHTKVFLRQDGMQSMKEAIKRYYTRHIIMIQTHYRRHKAQKLATKLIQAIIKLQGTIRMLFTRKAYRIKRHAASTIKYFFISKKLRKKFIMRYQAIMEAKRSKAATNMQSAYRMYKHKKRFRVKLAAYRMNRLNASVGIQKYYRRHVAYKKYRQLVELKRQLSSIVIIQACYRSHMASKHFLKTRRAVIKMQSVVRMYKQHSIYTHQLIGVIMIQCHMRKVIYAKRYQTKLKSCITIQTLYRGFKARQWVFVRYNYIICLQTWMRKTLMKAKYKKTYRCLQRLQALIRMRFVRKQFKRTKKAVVKIQSLLRGRLYMFRYHLTYAATIAIQCIVRRHQAQKKFLRTYYCFVMVQAAIRKFLVYRQYKATRRCAILLQAWIRVRLSMRAYRRQCAAILRLQTFGRMMNAYRAYNTAIISIITMQCVARKLLARVKYLQERKKMIAIQALMRGHIAREKVGKQVQALIKLQAFGRMINACKAYNNSLISIIIMQAFARRCLMVKMYHYVRAQAILIQSKVRAFLMRKAYQYAYKMVVRMQSFGRMIIARQSYESHLVSILVIQTMIRKFLIFTLYKRKKRSAIQLQATYRMHRQRSDFKYHIFAVNMISKNVRTYFIYKKYHARRRSCIRIQLVVKSWLRNLRLFRRIKRLHYACSTALNSLSSVESSHHLNAIVMHFKHYPEDRYIRFPLGNMRSILHSCILGRNDQLIIALKFSTQEILDIDKYGRNSIHYVGQIASVACLRILSETLNSYKYIVEPNTMQSLDEDDEDEKDTAGVGNEKTAELKQAIAASVRKSMLKQGWLKKKRGGLMWQKRYVILTEDYIIYYKNQNSLQNPKFAIPLLGCSVNRVTGKEPILEVKAPNMGDKRGIFFTSSSKKSMMFMAENERELQEWLVPLKAVAGVQNLRTQPVNYINNSLRSLWLNSTDLFNENVLHILARKLASSASNKFCFYDTSEEEERLEDRLFDKNNVLTPPVCTSGGIQSDVIPMIAWCVEFGCEINAINCDQQTPLYLAVQSHAASLSNIALTSSATSSPSKSSNSIAYTPKDIQELIYCLLIKGSDAMLQGSGNGQTAWDLAKGNSSLKTLMGDVVRQLTISPLMATSSNATLNTMERDYTNNHKIKGYSYLSIYFTQQQFQNDCKSQISDEAGLVISVYNVKKQLLENVKEVRHPAFCKRQASNPSGNVQEFFWGRTWHMQTPLENLEMGSYIVIDFYPEPSQAVKTSASASYMTSSVFPIKTDLIDSGVQMLTLTVPVHEEQGKQLMNPIAMSSEKSNLFMELVVNTRDREVDLLTLLS